MLQIPYRIHALCRPHRPLLSTRVCQRFGQSLIALLLINWVLGVLLER